MITVQSTGFWRHHLPNNFSLPLEASLGVTILTRSPRQKSSPNAPSGPPVATGSLLYGKESEACKQWLLLTHRVTSRTITHFLLSPALHLLAGRWESPDGTMADLTHEQNPVLKKKKKGTKVYTIQHFCQELWFKCPNMIRFKSQRKSKASLHCALSSFFKVRGAHTSWDSLGAVLTQVTGGPSWSSQPLSDHLWQGKAHSPSLRWDSSRRAQTRTKPSRIQCLTSLQS